MYFPVGFDVREKLCLVVGGGEVGERKVGTLIQMGAHVRVVAPSIRESLLELLSKNEKNEVIKREYEKSDLEEVWMVIAATDNRQVNITISNDAKGRRLPVNVVDDPELCTFIFPAIVDRNPVVISVCTGGSSPVLARLIKSKLEALFPSKLGRLATFAHQNRDKVKSVLKDMTQRRMFWDSLMDGDIAEMILAGEEEKAEKVMAQRLEEGKSKPTIGEVYLVGSGPGDPDLMTFKAVRLLQKADVVLHDGLIAEPILRMARKDAECFSVSKLKTSSKRIPQDEITQLMIKHAKEGKNVCRLKGGDPFIFGRGGEELDSVLNEGISCYVVPGVTAAMGCASYAGIPLTHRDYAHSVSLVTAHNVDQLDWVGLSRPMQTIVLYMGVATLSTIFNKLIEHGMNPETKAAIIENGTTPQQRVFVGTMVTLPEIAAQNGAVPPAITIVGDVVGLRKESTVVVT